MVTVPCYRFTSPVRCFLSRYVTMYSILYMNSDGEYIIHYASLWPFYTFRTAEVHHGEAFLQSDKQILADQGTTVFQQCHGMQGNKFDKQIHLGSTPPKSVAEYIAEKESSEGIVRRRQEEAASKLKTFEKQDDDDRERDELDELLLEETESQVQQPQAPKRLPGCTQGTLGLGKAVPQKKQGGDKTEKGAARSLASLSTATPTKSLASASASSLGISASAAPIAEGTPFGGPPSVSAGGKASGALDSDMQMVADKHMETEGGSSIKALYGLEPSFFLIKSDKRYGQSAKVRGVTRLGYSIAYQNMSYGDIWVYYTWVI